jgi:hypothetical protein
MQAECTCRVDIVLRSIADPKDGYSVLILRGITASHLTTNVRILLSGINGFVDRLFGHP